MEKISKPSSIVSNIYSTSKINNRGTGIHAIVRESTDRWKNIILTEALYVRFLFYIPSKENESYNNGIIT